MLEYKDNQLLNRKNRSKSTASEEDNIKANEIFINDEEGYSNLIYFYH